MISKYDLKTISSFKMKKYRDKHQKIFVEGLRVVEDALQSSYNCERLILTQYFIERNSEVLRKEYFSNVPHHVVTEKDFFQISDTQSPQGIGLVIDVSKRNRRMSANGISIYLDNISDPGNAGTIIRTACWFGFRNIIFSNGSVDIYNPKLIRSASGAYFYSNLFIDDVDYNFLSDKKENQIEIVGADLTGEDYEKFVFAKDAVLVVGNEGNGISETVKSFLSRRIVIPKKGFGESLNVSSAFAIIASKASQ